MKTISERATRASAQHQRGSLRKRSAVHGASSTSAEQQRHMPARRPCGDADIVRACAAALAVRLPAMCDEGEDHE
ncbi:hypothetical protein FOC34_09140 [Burkholderia multivorans]|uniref:hypothetical protein n=1 Tax=Burkholderia multivorans TaxID=87883 RepID=UPI0012DE62AE|nr:hypothetical protein [Burkholderia multivorans]QGR85323.1 hypothetical protein FOC34_09140 [Burkholderia multivorans]